LSLTLTYEPDRKPAT